MQHVTCTCLSGTARQNCLKCRRKRRTSSSLRSTGKTTHGAASSLLSFLTEPDKLTYERADLAVRSRSRKSLEHIQ